MDALALAPSEGAFLAALNRLGVRYLIVGMSAALLHGARGVTEDVDLWFERGMRPPGLGGAGLDDRFDVVLTASGLEDFAAEYGAARQLTDGDLILWVLPLARILASKRAANRPKDQAQIPALEAALAVERDEGGIR